MLTCCADRFASDGDKDGADAALYAADRAHKHCQTEDAMLDAMEAAEAQYDAQKQPGDATCPACPEPPSTSVHPSVTGHGFRIFASLAPDLHALQSPALQSLGVDVDINID